MAESREFRTMLETKERELIALCDQQIQSLNAQVRLVSVSPRWLSHLSVRRKRLRFNGILMLKTFVHLVLSEA